MKKYFSRITKESAVSPVVAVMLILSLTIVLAAISAVAFISYSVPNPAPILGVSITEDDGIVSIKHLNGDVLYSGEYIILINNDVQNGDFGDFGPGDVIKLDVPSGEILSSVSLVYLGYGSETLIAYRTFSSIEPVIPSVTVNGLKYILAVSHFYDVGGFGVYKGYIDISKKGDQIVIVLTRDGVEGSKEFTFSSNLVISPGSSISLGSSENYIGLRGDSRYLDLVVTQSPYLLYDAIAEVVN